ncbi:glycosyltransferase family A protein [Metabacillus fastidiosus]|uniref:glycosyltransferase family 2 protein n=1 Tax=Metabacillus fastidiosus TaxID=1458 RepID=UPI002E238F61|nr:glycosyltransferase family A protein [Metabacillus fastidiosus]
MTPEYSPLVTIIIPCYNYGKYVNASINSLLNSTFQDIEIIVVDDGSTDQETIEILDQLNRSKTQLIRQSNQGLHAVRNNAIPKARGKYIISLDPGDELHPTFMEKAFWILETYPEIGFVSSGLQAVGTEDWKHIPPAYNFYKQLFHNNVCGHAMFRKQCWYDVGGYKKMHVMGYEDWDFWISAGEKGWLGYIIPEILMYYLRVGHSMVHNAIEHHDLLVKQIKEFHPNLYHPKKLAELKTKWSQFHDLAPNLKDPSLIEDLNSYIVKSIPKHKNRILFILPWIKEKALEPEVIDFIKKLDKQDTELTIVTTMGIKNSEFEHFNKITTDIFQMTSYFPHFYRDNNFFKQLLFKLITSRGIDTIYINNSYEGFQELYSIKKHFPYIPIKNLYPWLDNNSSWDYVRVSIEKDKYIDEHIVTKQIKEILINVIGDKSKLITK